MKLAMLASLASALVVPRPRGRGLTALRNTYDQSVGDDDSTLSFMAACLRGKEQEQVRAWSSKLSPNPDVIFPHMLPSRINAYALI